MFEGVLDFMDAIGKGRAGMKQELLFAGLVILMMVFCLVAYSQEARAMKGKDIKEIKVMKIEKETDARY